MATKNIEYTTWKKDADFVLTSLADLGYFVITDFDDGAFDDLESGDVITPPIAAQYANPELELNINPSIDSSVLWQRDYIKMECDFTSSTQTTASTSGELEVQFFPSIKGHYNEVEWDFGNGFKSSNAEPFHKFINNDPTEKLFTVILSVSGPSGKAKKTKVDYIKLPGKV